MSMTQAPYRKEREIGGIIDASIEAICNVWMHE